MSMAKKQALGRGMDAIFLDNSIESDESVTTLRISQIEPRKDQPRKVFNSESLSQLADSIAANGLIQPIVVRESDDSAFYQIIAGERRWRAAKMAGLSEVPVVVIDADDKKTAEYALIENIQREDLSPVEEARGYRSLIDQFGLTQDQVAKQVGKSRAAITNTLRLLELPEGILDKLSDKSLSAGHARALLGLNDKSKIESAAKFIIEHDLSVRAAEDLVRKFNRPERITADPDPMEAAYYNNLEQKITASIGCKVQIKYGGNNKSLTISYTDSNDLESIIRRLVDDQTIFD